MALVLVSFWGLSPKLQAQEFRFERFTVNEGLASSKVFDVAQDGRGLIWIGTELGLCRYNGSAFKTYGVLDDAVFFWKAAAAINAQRINVLACC